MKKLRNHLGSQVERLGAPGLEVLSMETKKSFAQAQSSRGKKNWARHCTASNPSNGIRD